MGLQHKDIRFPDALDDSQTVRLQNNVFCIPSKCVDPRGFETKCCMDYHSFSDPRKQCGLGNKSFWDPDGNIGPYVLRQTPYGLLAF